jgi:tricorn protease
MKPLFRLVSLVLFVLLLAPALAGAINVTDTRMLTQPAISKTHVAFVYAGDLWVAGLDGRNVRRLTSVQGASNPAFSPDGSLVAFTAQYEGNADVYIVPVAGGVPTRLTWHPGRDVVQGFTPDGSAVLFTSGRMAFTGAHTQLFTVPVKGGSPTQLEIPNASRAAFSPDGTRLGYNPLPEAFGQWKHYRGGRASTIWLYQFANHSVEQIPQPAGRSNDVDPMWIGDLFYFRSDRNGEFNLFSFDPRTKTVTQLSSHNDFPVLGASAGGGKIVYEQAGYLHVLDPAAGQHARLNIGVTADLVDLRPRFAKGTKYIRNADLSPSGARAVFEFRGDIVTVPAEKGDPRNLTATTGANERSPIWSPDGKSIAYFSDASGEYQLVVESQDGKGQPKSYPLVGAGFYENPAWSPDSRKIAYTDNSWSVYWIDIETGVAKKIGSEKVGPSRTLAPAWAPDSRWIVYTLGGQTYIQTVYVYSVEQDKSFAVTDGLSEVSEPAFDQSGKYLYFFASTDAGPVKDWFAMSNADMRITKGIYLAVLKKDLPSPLAKESDEEKGTAKDTAKDAAKDTAKDAKPKDPPAAGAAPGDKPKDAPKPVEPVTIDFDGLSHRILALPLPVADYTGLRAGEAGQIFFIRTIDGKGALHHYDLNTRKDETLLPEVNDYSLSGDGKKLMYRSATTWAIGPAKGKIEPGTGKLAVEAIEVKIDPPAEWKQIFAEAWRINRDFFYATNMHGADWPLMRQKYSAFLPDLATRDDLNRVIQWMCSELGVGHHRVGGGDYRAEPATVPGGLLGADYSIENGRYRFKKVYGGLNWNPELRSPLTEPGVDVKTGEYLLAVAGQDLRPPANLYALFENTSGKIVEITVGPNPDGTASRTVSVVPVASENALRNRDWVEGNLKKVNDATGGRVAYVYVPNTTTQGHTYFKRYFYPQAHKDAIIVDERFNGGGQIADYYIDMLRRPFVSYWNMRYGEDLPTPTGSIQGPRVMLINEMAGSGGDLLPWMWRKFKMGPLVGKRTWGGLVGTLGFPVLMDGGSVTAPNLAIWTAEEGWTVENEGVPPDIEVEQTPADVIAGRDPQLEKAIQVVMDELKKNPPAKPKRPAYPIRGNNKK